MDRPGQVAHNEEMKAELEGIVDGLQTHLADVKTKADRQLEDYSALLQERAELLDKLQTQELDRDLIEHQNEQLSQLQQVINANPTYRQQVMNK